MADIKVPGIGPVDKKYVIIGLAATGGMVAYAWWRSGSEPEADIPVGDVGDIGEGDGAYSNPIPGGSTVDSEPIDPETLPPATVDAWTRRAIERLEGIGYDPQLVADVLGRYIGHQRLTNAQADIVRVALAMVGPVPGKDYPILLNPAAPGPEPEPEPDPKPKPKPPPAKPKPKPPAKPKRPAYRSMTITKRGQSLSDLVASYNKRYKTRHSWRAIWDFNLKWRSASTQKTLRSRGPHKVYIGSTFWFPK